jgi:cytoskeleton protein RodZ
LLAAFDRLQLTNAAICCVTLLNIQATIAATNQPCPVNPSEADTAITPLATLGQALQEAREGRGLSTAALAAQLRMGEEQLQALEAGDRARLPETVFVIAQARRIAAALGVEINPLLLPLKQETATIKAAPAPLSGVGEGRERQSARIRAQSYTSAMARPRTSGLAIRWMGSLALLAGVAAAGTWAWQQGPEQLARFWPKAAAPSATPKPLKPKPPTPPRAPVAAAAPATELNLTAVQPSWLAVRSGDGKQLFEGTFKGSQRFPLKNGLQVLAGRPDLVQVSLGSSPAKPLGRIDQIRWVTFKAPTP